MFIERLRPFATTNVNARRYHVTASAARRKRRYAAVVDPPERRMSTHGTVMAALPWHNQQNVNFGTSNARNGVRRYMSCPAMQSPPYTRHQLRHRQGSRKQTASRGNAFVNKWQQAMSGNAAVCGWGQGWQSLAPAGVGSVCSVRSAHKTEQSRTTNQRLGGGGRSAGDTHVRGVGGGIHARMSALGSGSARAVYAVGGAEGVVGRRAGQAGPANAPPGVQSAFHFRRTNQNQRRNAQTRCPPTNNRKVGRHAGVAQSA